MPQQEIHAVFPSPRMMTAKVTLFITWLQLHLADGWWGRAVARKRRAVAG